MLKPLILRFGICVVFLFGLISQLMGQLDLDSLEIKLLTASENEKAYILNRLSKENSAEASDKAISYAKQALDLAQKYEDHQNEALALENLCLGYLYNDIYDKALENGLAALEIYKGLDNVKSEAYILSSLGWLYYDIQNADLAFEYHQKVLDIYLSLDDKDNIAMSYNSLGLVYSMKGEYEKALSYYLLSLEVAQEDSLNTRAIAAHSNLGMTYTSLGSYRLALEHLQNALSIRNDNASVLQKAEIWNQLGKTYTCTRQFSKAAESFQQARDLIEQSTSKAAEEKLMDNLEFSAEYFAAKGEFQNAFEAFKEYSAVRNTILSDEKTNRLSEMRLLYETEKKENEIQLLEKQKKIDRLLRNGSIAGFLLFFIIGYLTYSKLKNKHERAQLEKERLKDKLDYKNNELTTFALHFAKRNELLNNFVASLSRIEKYASGKLHNDLKKLIQSVKLSQFQNEEVEEFHLNVEIVNKDFLYNLTREYPDLTDNEKRLSAQVRLNLSNKDIAALNRISVKSVEMARYRLRKRFGLDTKESLTEFLRNF